MESLDCPTPYQVQAMRPIIRPQRQGLTVTVRWIPSHEGIAGNEAADVAATQATGWGKGQSANTESNRGVPPDDLHPVMATPMRDGHAGVCQRSSFHNTIDIAWRSQCGRPPRRLSVRHRISWHNETYQATASNNISPSRRFRSIKLGVQGWRTFLQNKNDGENWFLRYDVQDGEQDRTMKDCNLQEHMQKSKTRSRTSPDCRNRYSRMRSTASTRLQQGIGSAWCSLTDFGKQQSVVKLCRNIRS